MIKTRIFLVGFTALLMLCNFGCRGIGLANNKTVFRNAFASSDQTPIDAAGISTAEIDSNRGGEEVRFQSPGVSEFGIDADGSFPIDLPAVLQLAGADNWNVQIARQRVQEASAEYCAAKSAWLPSLTFSLGFNKHEGELQSTEGDVVSVSRNSLFLGAGAGVANAPLNGGSGGPPRMFVDFSLADAVFKPLAAARIVGAEQARQNRVVNDTMLEATLAYYDLVRAQSQLAIVQTNLVEAQELGQLTAAFVEAGKGTPADSNRVSVIVNNRRNQLVAAETEIKTASARLATVLQLDPTKLDPQAGLIAMDAVPVPVHLTDVAFDLNATIAHAQSLRCEIAEANARTRSAQSELMAEQWRPWLPNLYLGYSGGLFGGGQGGDLPSLDGRSDLDVVVSWQVKNLGFGTRAKQDVTRSRMLRRDMEMKQVRDQIAEQVTTTYQQVNRYRATLSNSAASVDEAGSGLAKNLAAIKGLEGLPLEAISSLDQLAKARAEYLSNVVNYNQWQVRLLRAAGQSLGPNATVGESANCNSDGCDVALPICSSCFEKPSRCNCSH